MGLVGEKMSGKNDILPRMVKDYYKIEELLDELGEDVQNRRNITDISELKDFLIKHREYEETELYPKLDQALDEEQKKHIIDRIEQIVEY